MAVTCFLMRAVFCCGGFAFACSAVCGLLLAGRTMLHFIAVIFCRFFYLISFACGFIEQRVLFFAEFCVRFLLSGAAFALRVTVRVLALGLAGALKWGAERVLRSFSR